MKMNLRTLATTSLFAIGMTAAASNAMADCSSIGSSEWNNYAMAMNAAVESQNYEEALNSAKRMSLICDREPSLNFSMSRIYAKMGDEKNAAVYAKKATDYIADYPVPPMLAERIWMNRAEYDLPYKAELEALQAKTADYDTIKAEYDARVQEDKEKTLRNEFMQRSTMANWWGALWAGVGITAGGIILTGVGGGLIANADKIEQAGEMGNGKSGFAVTKPYVAGWTMLGAGLAMIAGGGVLLGISVARYTKFQSQLEAAGEVKEDTISFQVFPGYASFGMTF